MAHVAHSAQAPQFIAAIVESVSTVYAQFDNWRHVRRTIAALSALSDRELNDIGLSRSEIIGTARATR
jgi:uncharacterized protein YjiS (DUF1127 family)